MSSYEETLTTQSSNSQIGACKTYYSWLYSLINNSMNEYGTYLEIGAGAGISRFFLKNLNILRTDFLPWANGEVVGGVDAQNLPYLNEEFDGVIGVDMIHHVTSPSKLLQESVRVTKSKGQLIFIEPYVSLFSYAIYKLFHPERVTIPLNFDSEQIWVTESANDGDQSVAQRLFCTRSGKKYLLEYFKDEISVEVDYLSPFSFYLTGGLNKPLRTPTWLICLFISFDSRIPKIVRKFTASRMIIKVRLRG